jgi:PKD repeat protein
VQEYALVYVYNNARDFGNEPLFYPTLNEYGDEVELAGTNRLIQRFEFLYFGEFHLLTEGEVAQAKGRIRFYKNDGPDMPDSTNTMSPKTLVYESQPFPLSSGYNWKVLDGLCLLVPDRLTWTVEFINLPGIYGKRAGLVFYNPRERTAEDIGESFDDFWMKVDGAWSLYRFGGNPAANFGAQAAAVSGQVLAESQPHVAWVTISNTPPIITAANITENGLVGVELAFSASAKDAGEGALSYEWDFGDGTRATNALVTHAYTSEGQYNVTLTVSDESNATASNTFAVQITSNRQALRFSSVPVTSVKQGENYHYAVATITPGSGQVLRISALARPAWVTFVDNGDGTALLSGTPGNSQVGDHLVSLELSDDQDSVRQSFTITVLNVNDRPTITGLADQVMLANAELGPLRIVIGDLDPGASVLTLTAECSNPALIGWQAIILAGTGAERTLWLRPNTNAAGRATITLRVSDGELSAQTGFMLMVNEPARHKLTLIATAGGAIQANPAAENYIHGTAVTLTAVPLEGYGFASWAGDISGRTNPVTVVVDRDVEINANFKDNAPPVIVIETLPSGPTTNEIVEFSGSITDNVGLATVTWERDGKPQGNLVLDQGRFKVSGLRLQRGENQFKVIVADAAGNVGQGETVVSWALGIVLTVLNAGQTSESHEAKFPVMLTSQGEVAGMTFELKYDSQFLEKPAVSWARYVRNAAQNLVAPGRLRLSFSLGTNTIPAGVTNLATVKFMARSVPFSLVTLLEPELIEVSDRNKQVITTGTDALLGLVRIRPRDLLGDVNNNGIYDPNDASALQRLILGLDELRTWDLYWNDVNENNQLDSGDVNWILELNNRYVTDVRPHGYWPGQSKAEPMSESSEPLVEGRGTAQR